ncbi:MAG: right-handed parallel beta-helix repeat-containing protein [Phycisphaerales bacterium]|nr:right-handed parallel beta-helix repeat-containing protein [Phycisphaerales bacterium]
MNPVASSAVAISAIGIYSLCSSATADVLSVPGTFPTIQDAIDAAVDGDKISLAAGVYQASGLDTQGKAITISGAVVWPADQLTLIKGVGNASIFRIDSGEGQSTIIENMVLHLGDAPYGGAMFINGASPTVSNVLFTGNQADNGGGAVFVGPDSDPMFEDCTFYMNASGSSGGAVHVRGGSVTFEQCKLTYNQGGWGGGAIDAFSGHVVLNDCELHQNSAPNRGGAINTYGGSLAINDSFFQANASGIDGGAVFTHTTQLTVQDTMMDGNNALAGSGGALLVYEGSADLQASSFQSNSAQSDGGAIVIRYGEGSTVSGCTLLDNSAGQRGGAVAHLDTQVSWSNSDVSANTSASSGGGMFNFGSMVQMAHCTVQQNNSSGTPGGGLSNIMAQGTMIGQSSICGNLPDQVQGAWADQGGTSVENLCLWAPEEAACCVGTGCAFTSEDMCSELGGLWLAADQDCSDCPDSCLTDINGDGQTNLEDLLQMVAAWGPCF